MIFTQRDYKYGTTFTSYTGSENGCPPALVYGRAVCSEENVRYIEIATLASEMIVEAMGDKMPQIDIIFRSPSSAIAGAHNHLCLMAYLMQEYHPDGVNHLLYKAVTQERFSDFEKGIKQYKKPKLTEGNYKFGTIFTSYTGSTTGCPPALGNDRAVCSEENVRYIEVATLASEMIVAAMGDNMPQIDIIFRSSSSQIGSVHNHLCLLTYIMQEYHPDGVFHPLYNAVTQQRFSDFEKDIEEYRQQGLVNWLMQDMLPFFPGARV
jgi:hypothetical protein